MDSPSSSVLSLLATCNCFCFDVDSTVIDCEGIDTLAATCGKGDIIANFTKQAMNGQMTFQDALTQRLDIMKPSTQQIQQCEQESNFQLTPNFGDLVQTLKSLNKFIYLISGGFRQMIEPINQKYNITHKDNIIANNLIFNKDGSYLGFDDKEFTSRSGGKARAIQHIIDNKPGTRVVMIGDGVTDLEARPPASLFIGFGGVVTRQPVKAGADWFISDWKHLITALKQTNVT